jgi:hypothetical protein
MSHNYVNNPGGAAASFGIVQGAAASNPVAPSLSDNKQVIIGRIYLPANTTSTDQEGVIYTKEPIPLLGNNPDIWTKFNFNPADKADTEIVEGILENLESFVKYEEFNGLSIAVGNKIDSGDAAKLKEPNAFTRQQKFAKGEDINSTAARRKCWTSCCRILE